MELTNFWDVHGIWFVLFMCIFPRLTLVLSSVVSGGLLWWLGWIFAPRLLVAILATSSYWETNTILVVCTWFWAIGGEGAEKKVGRHMAGNWRKKRA
jgi:hypothetical protein